MLEAIIDAIISANGVLGGVIGLLVYALHIERSQCRHLTKKLDQERDTRLQEYKEQGTLMRDLEAALATVSKHRDASILHRERLEVLMREIAKKL